MTPVDFYLSQNSFLDELDLAVTELVSNDEDFTAVEPECKFLTFSGPVNINRFSLYRLRHRRLEIVSPFGCVSIPSGELEAGNRATLTVLCPEGLASWSVDLANSWRKGSGLDAPDNAMRAKILGGGCFEPLHTTSHVRVSGRLIEWVIVFLPETHSSIRKSPEGGADIFTPSGLIFKLPPGKAANLALARSIQWAISGSHGVFVLEEPPW